VADPRITAANFRPCRCLASREKGRAGWDAGDWSEGCKAMLHEHVDKGDARDVGLLAAFLFNMREA